MTDLEEIRRRRNELALALEEAEEIARRVGFDLWGSKSLGLCQSCGTEVGWKGLVLDHDHSSGLVRGYLCRSCNTSEGYGGTANGIAEYLAAPPAFDRRLPPLVYEGYGNASPIWKHVAECTAMRRLESDCGEACRELRERIAP